MHHSFHLLITTLRAGLHPEHKQRLNFVIRQASEKNWRFFLELSDHHNVSNLLRSSFNQNEVWDALPDFVQQTLNDRYYNTVAWSLKLNHSLDQVVAAFQQAAIPLIPWKGPALSQRLFGDISKREYVDLDFLIPPQYQASVETELHELGYNKAADFQNLSSNLANSNDHCQSWRHLSSQTLLEIHWKPFPGAFNFPLAIDELLDRSFTIPHQKLSIRQLSLEDEFLLLLCHGAKHHWCQLNWLYDFTVFFQLYKDLLDWKLIKQQTQQLGCSRILKTALALSETLWQTHLPPPPELDRPATDATACHLASIFSRQLQQPLCSLPSPLNWKYRWLINSLLSRERYRDRLPVILSAIAYLFTPNHNDRELCPQIPPFSLGAWVIRPFRLIYKYALHPIGKNSNLS